MIIRLLDLLHGVVEFCKNIFLDAERTPSKVKNVCMARLSYEKKRRLHLISASAQGKPHGKPHTQGNLMVQQNFCGGCNYKYST
jgi:hypothetical protein